jgi:hypothetical protein
MRVCAARGERLRIAMRFGFETFRHGVGVRRLRREMPYRDHGARSWLARTSLMTVPWMWMVKTDNGRLAIGGVRVGGQACRGCTGSTTRYGTRSRPSRRVGVES